MFRQWGQNMTLNFSIHENNDGKDTEDFERTKRYMIAAFYEAHRPTTPANHVTVKHEMESWTEYDCRCGVRLEVTNGGE